MGSWLTTVVAIAGPGFVMGIPDFQRDLGASHIVASLAFGLYPLGFGLGPLVLAPISEVYGRNPMYRWSTVLFTCQCFSVHLSLVHYLCSCALSPVFFLPIALSPSVALVCVFRFLQGVVGSVGSTMVGGTIADIWQAKERGKPMALFSIGAFLGTVSASFPLIDIVASD